MTRGARVAALGFDLAAAAVLVLLACRERMPLLPVALMGSDSEAPFRVAHLILHGRALVPTPHAPESGYAFYWLLTPIVALSSSLRGVFRGYFALDSLAPALVYLGARLGTGGLATAAGAWPPAWMASRAVALLAGLQIALAPELVDSVQAGAHGYLAAWAAAVVTCGVLAGFSGATWGPFVATLALPVAAMIHPFAACLAPATAWLWWRWLRRSGATAPLVAAAGALAIAAPQLWRHVGPFLVGDTGHAERLRAIAESNGRTPDLTAMLLREIGQLFAGGPVGWTRVHLAWAAAIPALALLGLLTRRRGPSAGVFAPRRGGASRELIFCTWLVLAFGAFLGLAAAIGYLQAYHLRLFFPALAVALAWVAVQATGLLGQAVAALAGRGGRTTAAVACAALVLAGACFLGGIRPRQRDEPALRYQSLFRTLGFTEQVADAVARDAGDRPIVLDTLQLRLESPVFDGSAAVHDLLLRGVAPGRFVLGRDGMRSARFYFVAIGTQPWLDTLAATPLPDGTAPAALLGPLGRSDGIQEEERGMLLRTDGLAATRAWLAEVCARAPEAAVGTWRGGPYDYLVLVHEEVRAEATEIHVPRCLVGPP